MPPTFADTSAQIHTVNAWSRPIPWSAATSTPGRTKRDATNVDSEHRAEIPRPLQPTTKARALSVFQGPSITEFDVEILGTSAEGGILGRASGPIIDELGGVPSGASGSPVFLDGRLIGAIALTFGDPTLVGITPIAEMRSLARESISPLNKEPGVSKTPSATNSCSLLAAVGFRASASLHRLEEHFRSRLVASPAPTHRTESAHTAAALEPGSAVGAALITGDLRLGFIGTATEIQGDRLLAFGHPLLFTGPTQLALTRAFIFVTGRESSRSPSEKLGDFGDTIGTVVQDRSAGILARIGTRPRLIPFKLSVTDKDRSVTEKLSVHAAPLPSELSFLMYATTVEAFTRAMDRLGQGTATWKWSISVAHQEEPIVQEARAFDLINIADVAASSIFPLLDPLLEEGFDVQEVCLSASVEMRRTVEA